MYKISIVIPVYNGEKYIGRCLDSLLRQTYKNIEIIVIDDGSKDNTEAVCHEYANKDNRIIYKRIDNQGVSNARNEGIKLASGEYISFVDADDYLDASCYSDVSHCFSSEIDLISFGYVKEIEDKIINKDLNKGAKEILYDKNNFLKEVFVDGITCSVWNKVFKKSIIDDNRLLFDVNIYYSEDLLFLVSYVFHSNKIVHIDNGYYHWVINKESAIHKNFSKRNLTSLSVYEILKPMIEAEVKPYFYLHQGNDMCNIIKRLYYSDYSEKKDVLKKLKKQLRFNRAYYLKVKGFAKRKVKLILMSDFPRLTIKFMQKDV